MKTLFKEFLATVVRIGIFTGAFFGVGAATHWGRGWGEHPSVITRPDLTPLQESTVLIDTPDAQGSGVVIRRGDHIFVWTAGHLTGLETNVTVIQPLHFHGRRSGKIQHPARLIKKLPNADAALLELPNADPKYFSPIVFDLEHISLVGEPIIAVSNMFGEPFDRVQIPGAIVQTGCAPQLPDWDWPVTDEISVIVWPGSSGGPVFSSHNKVIGLIIGKAAPGISVFIPVRLLVEEARLNNLSWALSGGWCPNEQILDRLAKDGRR